MFKLVILQSMVRSGTTYLRDLLAERPEICVLGEVLYPAYFDFGWFKFLGDKVRDDPSALFPGRQPIAFKEYLETMGARNPHKLIVMDVKIEQLAESPTLSASIYAKPSQIGFILMLRANLLKQVVSDLIMHARIQKEDGDIHRNYVPVPERIIVRPDDVVHRMRWNSTMGQRYRDLVLNSKAPYIDILYEDLLGSGRDSTLAGLQNFLDLEPKLLQGRLVKQNPQPMALLVENYDELTRAVRQSEFAYCLHLPD